MQFYIFFSELKNRVLLVLLSWIFTIAICYNYKKNLLFFIFYSNNKIFSDNCFYFITTDVTDILSIYLTLSYFVTNQLTFIYFIYNIVIFISPGLYEFEYKKLKTIIKILSFIILINFFITNKLFLPTFWDFFSNFQEVNNNIPIYFEAKLTEYVDFYIFLYYSSGSVCILYILFYCNIHYSNCDLNILRKLKKPILLLCFLIATIITPPDIFSQITIGLGFFILTEVLIIAFILKNKIQKNL